MVPETEASPGPQCFDSKNSFSLGRRALAELIVARRDRPPHGDARFVAHFGKSRDLLRDMVGAVVAVGSLEPEGDAPQFLVARQDTHPAIQAPKLIAMAAPSSHASIRMRVSLLNHTGDYPSSGPSAGPSSHAPSRS
jgi:hypothetical protein